MPDNKKQKLKLVLINPKGLVGGKNSEFSDYWMKNVDSIAIRHSVYGISSALLIVAALTPSMFDIQIIDEHFEDIDFSKKYDLVGITAITQQAVRAYQIADIFREKGIKVAIGGIHATVMSVEAKQHADAVIIGEAENTWPEFINDLLEGHQKDFYKSSMPVDLKKSPIPRYDLLKPGRYKIAWMQTSRGCPHDCDFCVASKVYGKKYRYKTIEQVIEEVKSVKKVWQNPQIGFADDNMFMNKNYARELINKLAGLNIRWATQSDVAIAKDEEFLRLLKKSGCFMLFIGFESLSEAVLQSINQNKWKLKRLKEYPEIIRKIQSIGIGICGSFIVGFDSDNSEVFDRVSNFIVENNLYGASISVLTPLPGSALRERLKNKNRLLDTDWDSYTFFDVNFKPEQISVEQLQRDLLGVYEKVYSKQANIKRFKYFKNIYKGLQDK